MSQYVNESVANEFAEKGKLIGKTTPGYDTKGMWWEVYSYENRLVAACASPGGISCGEEITANELHLYTEGSLT